MWTLTKEFRFEASHQLLYHDGKCARLHGHSWKGKIYVTSKALALDGPKQGMVVDYGDLSTILKPLVDDHDGEPAHLDHNHLNNLIQNPTSENVAKWVFDYLEAAITTKFPPTVKLIAVEIEETCTARCMYQPAAYPR